MLGGFRFVEQNPEQIRLEVVTAMRINGVAMKFDLGLDAVAELLPTETPLIGVCRRRETIQLPDNGRRDLRIANRARQLLPLVVDVRIDPDGGGLSIAKVDSHFDVRGSLLAGVDDQPAQFPPSLIDDDGTRIRRILHGLFL